MAYDKKIKQIIPAPECLFSVYEDRDGKKFSQPVMCLALVEDDGVTYVAPMSFVNDKSLDIDTEDANFVGLSLKPIED